MSKLESREADCLKRWDAVERNGKFVPKLSFDADANFSGMANALQIQHNDEFGRCVTANINIDVGQIVLIEEAFLLSASSTNLKSVHEFYRLCPVLKCHVL